MTENGDDKDNSAEQNANENANQEATKGADKGADQSKTITMSQDELNKIISERIDKNNRSWEKKMADKEKEANEKAELDKLQGAEKLEREYQLKFEKLQKEASEASHNLKLAKAEAALSAKGLDPSFAPSMIGATDEETSAKIDSFAKMVEDQVAKTIKANTKKGAPPATNPSEDDPIKKAIFQGFKV